MAQRQLNTRIIIRNDTSTNWTAANPVLLKGELGIETDTGVVKYGDGVAKWESAQILNESNVVVKTAAPAASDSDYKLGTLWLDTTNNKAYLIYSIILAVIVLYNQRSNIKRLLNGTENKLSFKSAK